MSQADDNNKQPVTPPRLYRLPQQGMIAGVVAGLAEYFAIDVTVLRILFVVALFATGGFMILPYIIAAIVMPVPGEDAEKPGVKGADIGQKIEGLAHEMRESGRADRARNWLGIGLVVLGVWILIGYVWPAWVNIRWDVLWPAVLIIVGVLFLMRGRK